MWGQCVINFIQDLDYDLLDYGKSSNIRSTLAGNEIVDHSDVVGAAPTQM